MINQESRHSKNKALKDSIQVNLIKTILDSIGIMRKMMGSKVIKRDFGKPGTTEVSVKKAKEA